jgi:Rad3-related DNA helicase
MSGSDQEFPFYATVVDHSKEGEKTILHTLDSDPLTDLELKECHSLVRVGSTLSDEQKEKIILWNTS